VWGLSWVLWSKAEILVAVMSSARRLAESPRGRWDGSATQSGKPGNAAGRPLKLKPAVQSLQREIAVGRC
jgi:hypothetical protein